MLARPISSFARLMHFYAGLLQIHCKSVVANSSQTQCKFFICQIHCQFIANSLPIIVNSLQIHVRICFKFISNYFKFSASSSSLFSLNSLQIHNKFVASSLQISDKFIAILLVGGLILCKFLPVHYKFITVHSNSSLANSLHFLSIRCIFLSRHASAWRGNVYWTLFAFFAILLVSFSN